MVKNKNLELTQVWNLPVLPLNDTVLFPGILLPVIVFNQQGKNAIEKTLESDEKSLIVVSVKPESRDKLELKKDDLFNIGVRGIIGHVNKLDHGFSLSLSGLERVKIQKVEMDGTYLKFEAKTFPVEDDLSLETDAMHREVIRLFDEMRSQFKTESGIPVLELIENVTNPLHQLYLISLLMAFDVEKCQKILEAGNRKDATRYLHDFISYEYNVQKIRDKISSQVANELGKEQKEYVLRRQLFEIKKELGEETEQGQVLELKKQLQGLPESIKPEVEKHINHFESLNQSSADYFVIQSYLKKILELPWSRQTKDNLDLNHAELILNQDHYGLKPVKERILEHLAVMKLNPQARAPILCFVGPPGVGKTSLGQSIAKALGRKFERMSLGGMHDEAELRGHRRTYVGALPGRIIQAISRAQVSNPLIMLDEIDKLGVDFRGDPAAALMEILDPAQNNSFHDNYLDVPFDLSHVFFITTANTTSNIPKPLLDRMEVLELSGYCDFEKIEMAKSYLIPQVLAEVNLANTQIHFEDSAIAIIIQSYTREAGVRELRRCLGQIVRKMAKKIVVGEKCDFNVSKDELNEYLGAEKIFSESNRENWTSGVATGLAWTEAGGDIIFIETSFIPEKKGEVKITGNIGEIMKESVTCALSYILAHPNFVNIDHKASNSGLHVHVPAGAIPKDGPSAGVAIAVALASLYLGKPVRKDVAMTGEITLCGPILPVGGIKEKVMAAHRAGLKNIILPKTNFHDLAELPVEVKNDLTFIFVTDLNEVLEKSILNFNHGVSDENICNL